MCFYHRHLWFLFLFVYGECDARWYLCTGASRKFLHPKRRIFEEKTEEFFEEKKLKQIKKQFEKGKCMLYHSTLK